MITVKMNGYSVFITGHAGLAEYGSDILCAGVSTLAYTLAGFVQRNAGSMQKKPSIVLESGKASIKCAPKPEFIRECSAVYNAISAMFLELSKKYPKNLKFLRGRG